MKAKKAPSRRSHAKKTAVKKTQKASSCRILPEKTAPDGEYLSYGEYRSFLSTSARSAYVQYLEEQNRSLGEQNQQLKKVSNIAVEKFLFWSGRCTVLETLVEIPSCVNQLYPLPLAEEVD